MLGPNRTTSLRTIGSFLKRKKKSSPYGPYLPETFHCVEAVRRRTLCHASRKGQRTSSHNGRTRPETTRSPLIATLLPQKPRANFGLNTDFFVQRNNWTFEVLLPPLQSRLTSSQNVVLASRIIKNLPPLSLAAFMAHKAFAFWASCGFFAPTVLLISL